MSALSSLYKFHSVTDFTFQHGKILVQLLRGYLGVMLRGGNFCMPQYFTYAFYRHTVVQCHDSEAVAAEVKGNRLLDTALLRYVLYGKYFSLQSVSGT